METPNKTQTNEILVEFLFLCKNCNNILFQSKALEKLCILLNEIALVFSESNEEFLQSSEIKIKDDNQNSVDFQCVYNEILCQKCKNSIGIYYISTTEILDNIKEKFILFESKLKFYAISENKFEDFREFCFENSLIESNLDHVFLLKEEKNTENEKENGFKMNKNDEFQEFNVIIKDMKKAFWAMNEGMKAFEGRLSQSEQTMGVLLTMIEKINKKVKTCYK